VKPLRAERQREAARSPPRTARNQTPRQESAADLASSCTLPALAGRSTARSARAALASAHQLRLSTIFWRPGNLNLARRSASCACTSNRTQTELQLTVNQHAAEDSNQRWRSRRHCSRRARPLEHLPYISSKHLLTNPGSQGTGRAGEAAYLRPVSVLAADGQQNLADADPGTGALRLAEGAPHAGLQPIGSGAREHLVDAEHVERVHADAEVERILARVLHHVLVRSNPGRLQSLAADVLLLPAAQTAGASSAAAV